jgi:uncharacterized protein
MAGRTPRRKPRPGVDGYGRTPLHYAVIDGDLEAVRTRLDEGLDPDAADDNGWTPLHFAAARSNAAGVELLLARGANVVASDHAGNTALINAVFACTGDGECIRLLRAAGADPAQPNHHGVSAVSLARNIANHPVAQYFADLP